MLLVRDSIGSVGTSDTITYTFLASPKLVAKARF